MSSWYSHIGFLRLWKYFHLFFPNFSSSKFVHYHTPRNINIIVQCLKKFRTCSICRFYFAAPCWPPKLYVGPPQRRAPLLRRRPLWSRERPPLLRNVQCCRGPPMWTWSKSGPVSGVAAPGGRHVPRSPHQSPQTQGSRAQATYCQFWNVSSGRDFLLGFPWQPIGKGFPVYQSQLAIEYTFRQLSPAANRKHWDKQPIGYIITLGKQPIGTSVSLINTANRGTSVALCKRSIGTSATLGKQLVVRIGYSCQKGNIGYFRHAVNIRKLSIIADILCIYIYIYTYMFWTPRARIFPRSAL